MALLLRVEASFMARGDPWDDDSAAAEREHMVEVIRRRGVRDRAVLDAMRRFPRHELVPPAERALAYADQPLPIGFGQTISQPYIVAFMTELAAVQPGDRVLEIGTGSGYQTAILALLGAQVFSVEIIPELAERARRDLERLGVSRVVVKSGDGWNGWPEEAPFKAVVVAAATPEIPSPLLDQLAEGGRLIIPVDTGPVGTDPASQVLKVCEKRHERVLESDTLCVRFVPMTGEAEVRPLQ